MFLLQLLLALLPRGQSAIWLWLQYICERPYNRLMKTPASF